MVAARRRAAHPATARWKRCPGGLSGSDIVPASSLSATIGPQDGSVHRFPMPRPLTAGDDHHWSIPWAEDEDLHAFLPDAAHRTRTRAAPSDRGRHEQVLCGVPFGVKDVIRVDGLPTRAGSALPAELLAGPQASVVDRLTEAGAVVAGKTVTAEFALAEPGPTVNPRDAGRTPGGSSSGSAAAVGAGLVPFALGTQTIGSIIRPAAYCGIVGFRPSWGLVPTDGVIGNAPSFDTIGWFTADVASCRTIASVLLEGSMRPSEAVRGPVLGVPSDDYLADADAGARAAFDRALRVLQRGGLAVVQVPLPSEMRTLHHHVQVLQRYELARVHAEWFPRYGHLYRPRTAAAVREGRAIGADEYERSVQWRSAYRARLADTAAEHGIDAWVAPAATGLPPEGLTSTGSAVMSAPFSLAGQPAVSLPARPSGSEGLVHGVQVVALPGCDALLLDVARRIEDVFASDPPGPRP